MMEISPRNSERNSGVLSCFRRKYITGNADLTHRKAYITDLHRKSISLRIAHIPMRNTLIPGRFFAQIFPMSVNQTQSTVNRSFRSLAQKKPSARFLSLYISKYFSMGRPTEAM